MFSSPVRGKLGNAKKMKIHQREEIERGRSVEKAQSKKEDPTMHVQYAQYVQYVQYVQYAQYVQYVQ